LGGGNGGQADSERDQEFAHGVVPWSGSQFPMNCVAKRYIAAASV